MVSDMALMTIDAAEENSFTFTVLDPGSVVIPDTARNPRRRPHPLRRLLPRSLQHRPRSLRLPKNPLRPLKSLHPLRRVLRLPTPLRRAPLPLKNLSRLLKRAQQRPRPSLLFPFLGWIASGLRHMQTRVKAPRM